MMPLTAEAVQIHSAVTTGAHREGRQVDAGSRHRLAECNIPRRDVGRDQRLGKARQIGFDGTEVGYRRIRQFDGRPQATHRRLDGRDVRQRRADRRAEFKCDFSLDEQAVEISARDRFR